MFCHSLSLFVTLSIAFFRQSLIYNFDSCRSLILFFHSLFVFLFLSHYFTLNPLLSFDNLSWVTPFPRLALLIHVIADYHSLPAFQHYNPLTVFHTHLAQHSFHAAHFRHSFSTATFRHSF
jgi:hypothetical protein